MSGWMYLGNGSSSGNGSKSWLSNKKEHRICHFKRLFGKTFQPFILNTFCISHSICSNLNLQRMHGTFVCCVAFNFQSHQFFGQKQSKHGLMSGQAITVCVRFVRSLLLLLLLFFYCHTLNEHWLCISLKYLIARRGTGEKERKPRYHTKQWLK